MKHFSERLLQNINIIGFLAVKVFSTGYIHLNEYRIGLLFLKGYQNPV